MRPRTTLAALLVLTCLPAMALAQAPSRPGGITPISRPTFSPYLNLVRPGAPAGINYYGLVRPEFAFRNSLQGLQTEVDTNRQLITTGSGGTGGGALLTGHSSTFLNTGGYFLNTTGGSAGRGGVGLPPARAAAPARGAPPRSR